MPPCAQTECERLTGTTEKRSTEWPPSAIFIAAASPASPPPTIATRMPFVAMSVKNPSEESARSDEGHLRVDADGEEQKPYRDARVAGQALRPLAYDDAPVHREEPDAVREVPDGRGDADDVDYEDPQRPELVAHDAERPAGVLGDREVVETGQQAEAEVQDVERYEEEENDSRDALYGVEPVARVRGGEVVRPPLEGDEEAEDRVVDERDEDAERLYEDDVGDGLKVSNRVVEVRGPSHRLRVGREVF